MMRRRGQKRCASGMLHREERGERTGDRRTCTPSPPLRARSALRAPWVARARPVPEGPDRPAPEGPGRGARKALHAVQTVCARGHPATQRRAEERGGAGSRTYPLRPATHTVLRGRIALRERHTHAPAPLPHGRSACAVRRERASRIPLAARHVCALAGCYDQREGERRFPPRSTSARLPTACREHGSRFEGGTPACSRPFAQPLQSVRGARRRSAVSAGNPRECPCRAPVYGASAPRFAGCTRTCPPPRRERLVP